MSVDEKRAGGLGGEVSTATGEGRRDDGEAPELRKNMDGTAAPAQANAQAATADGEVGRKGHPIPDKYD